MQILKLHEESEKAKKALPSLSKLKQEEAELK